MRKLAGWSVVVAVSVAFGACGSDGDGVADNNFAVGGKSGSDSGTGGGAATVGTGGSINVNCPIGMKQCSGNTPQTCETTGWASGNECPFICDQGECVGSCKPGSTKCNIDLLQSCDAKGAWEKPTACEFGCDAAATGCKSSCAAGEFNCYGNQVRQCDPGPPAQWVPVSPALVCNAASGQKCDAQTGTCQTVQPIGGTTPNGKYYQYAIFTKGTSDFLGGYDVASFGDLIYVNRSAQYLDVYKVTLHDSDNDGKLQPNQHPDNPNAQGPMEQRTLELVQTYTKATESAPLATASQCSLYAWSNDRVFSLGPVRNGSVTEYVFGTQATQVVAQPAAATPVMSFLGYGHWDGRWYAGNESARRVFSFHEPTKSWVVEFMYPNLAGSHMDGLEVVVSPKTGEQFVYVTDMTSDFIGQYIRRPTGWEQEALFEYNDSTSSAIEGFGFGALNHFWATSGNHLYELGGGDLQDDLEPCPEGAQACGPELPACGTGQTCKEGCCSGGPVR